MVEISLSGSGEGPGGAIPWGYSTGTFSVKTCRSTLSAPQPPRPFSFPHDPPKSGTTLAVTWRTGSPAPLPLGALNAPSSRSSLLAKSPSPIFFPSPVFSEAVASWSSPRESNHVPLSEGLKLRQGQALSHVSALARRAEPPRPCRLASGHLWRLLLRGTWFDSQGVCHEATASQDGRGGSSQGLCAENRPASQGGQERGEGGVARVARSSSSPPAPRPEAQVGPGS